MSNTGVRVGRGVVVSAVLSFSFGLGCSGQALEVSGHFEGKGGEAGQGESVSLAGMGGVGPAGAGGAASAGSAGSGSRGAVSGGAERGACPDDTLGWIPPGEKQPVCVVLDACTSGELAYNDALQALVHGPLNQCRGDADCVNVAVDNRCNDCQNFVFNADHEDAAVSLLNDVENARCSSCPRSPLPCPEGPGLPARCVAGQCVGILPEH